MSLNITNSESSHKEIKKNFDAQVDDPDIQLT